MAQMYFCTVCNNPFDMGGDGIFDKDNNPICDKCAGIERDQEGLPWHSGETEKIMGDEKSEHIITRDEAFGRI